MSNDELFTQVSISSTFYVQIFRTDVVLAVFSSYVLALAKKLYKKCAHITLMKLTTGVVRACSGKIIMLVLKKLFKRLPNKGQKLEQ